MWIERDRYNNYSIENTTSCCIVKVNSLPVETDEPHVECVDGSEDMSGALHNTLPRLRHGHRRAVRQEHGLITGTQWQVGQVVSCYQHHL